MRAVGVRAYGGPEALELLDLEPTAMGPRDVRVQVTAAAVNPTDTLIRAGLHPAAGSAAGVEVPGMDVAGIVTEVGTEVDTGVAVGDRVMGIVRTSGEHGGYREDLVLPARSVTWIPKGASDVEAATLPMNGLTAQIALESLGLEAGQVIAVTGAAGTLGGYLVQLAAAAGLSVVADAADADVALVQELGADHIVPRGNDVGAAIRRLFPDGVDGLVDAAVLQEAVLPAVRDGGSVVTVRGWAGDGSRGLRVTPVMIGRHTTEWEKLEDLRRAVEAGQLTLRVADTYDVADAAIAHRRLAAGGLRGRLVLTF